MRNLFFTFALVTTMSVSAFASTPTMDQLSGLTLKMDRQGYYAAGGSIIAISAADEEGTFTVEHFCSDTYNLTYDVTMHIDGDGNVTIFPQVVGKNYYSGSLFWIVPDAAKRKVPADFTESDVITGKWENGKITINAWNVVTYSADSTQLLSIRHNEALTSQMVCPNATITRGRWEDVYSSDWETFLRWEKGEMEQPARVAYTEIDDAGRLVVMNFDKLFAWAAFDLDLDARSFSIDPEQVVYRYWGSSNGDYVLCKTPTQLRTTSDAATSDPVTGTISDDTRTLTLTDIAVLKSTRKTIDNINGKPIHTLVITLDNPLIDQPAVVGDVNGDGTVDIDDVNIVINMVLETVDKTPAADVSGDGTVDIEDVNTIINIILEN